MNSTPAPAKHVPRSLAERRGRTTPPIDTKRCTAVPAQTTVAGHGGGEDDLTPAEIDALFLVKQ